VDRQRTETLSRRRLFLCTALLGVAGLAAISEQPGTQGTAALLTSAATASMSVSTAAACTNGVPYAEQLATIAPGPTLWWRFDTAASATTVPDASGNGNAGTVVTPNGPLTSGLTFGTVASGLIDCDTTTGLLQAGGASDEGFIVSPTQEVSPTTYTVSAWVRTTTAAGGRLVGFGDSRTGSSASSDSALLVNRTGQPVFEVSGGSAPILLNGAQSIADGIAHLVVATRHGNSVALYVDGALVDSADTIAIPIAYPGYWRVGSDALNGVGSTDRDQAAATVDEVAVWDNTALPAATVEAMFASNHW
jgi:hypothetical protein